MNWRFYFVEKPDGAYEVCVEFLGAPGEGYKFTRQLPPDFSDFTNAATSDSPKRKWRRAPNAPTDEALLFCAGNLDTLKEIGSRLHQAVFKDPARDLTGEFLTLREAATATDESLRVSIDLSKAPRLARVPWEALYLDSEDVFLGIDTKSNVVRILSPNHPGKLPPAIRPPIRMLVAVANPRGDLETGAEVANIERRLADMLDESRDRYEVQTLPEATRNQFGSRVEDWKPHIIHFIGHGGFDDDKGLIYFHDEKDKAKRDPVDSASLRDLIRNDRPWLVVLNSCLSGAAARADPFGGAAQNLIRINIPFVVAMQSPISDEAAVRFSRRFYASLTRGEPVATAVTRGRNAIRSQADEAVQAELVTPVLYSTGGAERLAVIEPEPQPIPPPTPPLISIDRSIAVIGLVIAVGALYVGYLQWQAAVDPSESPSIATTGSMSPASPPRAAARAAKSFPAAQPAAQRRRSSRPRDAITIDADTSQAEIADRRAFEYAYASAMMAMKERSQARPSSPGATAQPAPPGAAAIRQPPPSAVSKPGPPPHIEVQGTPPSNAASGSWLGLSTYANIIAGSLFGAKVGSPSAAAAADPTMARAAAAQAAARDEAGRTAAATALAASLLEERRASTAAVAVVPSLARPRSIAGLDRLRLRERRQAYTGRANPRANVIIRNAQVFYPDQQLYFGDGSAELQPRVRSALEYTALAARNGARIGLAAVPGTDFESEQAEQLAWARLQATASFLLSRGVPPDILRARLESPRADGLLSWEPDPGRIEVEIGLMRRGGNSTVQSPLILASFPHGSSEPLADFLNGSLLLEHLSRTDLGVELKGRIDRWEAAAGDADLALARAERVADELERLAIDRRRIQILRDPPAAGAGEPALQRRVDARFVVPGAERIRLSGEGALSAEAGEALDRLSAWMAAHSEYGAYLGPLPAMEGEEPGPRPSQAQLDRVGTELRRRDVGPERIAVAPAAVGAPAAASLASPATDPAVEVTIVRPGGLPRPPEP